jgi:general secretion pathway protein K
VTGGALPGRRLGEGGVALIVVLLLLALLLTIVGEFSQAMRIEAVTAANFRSGITETWLAEAAYQRALAEILPDALGHELDVDGILVFRRTRLGTPAVPERLDVRVEPGRLSYRLTDESARINLNRATRDVLDRLLQDLGAEKTDRDTIIDSIQDWRDPNGEHRVNGAESDDYYLKLPMPYRARNANLESITELLQIKGITPAIYNGTKEHPGLASFVTVRGNNTVNVNTASATVLTALGFSAAEITQFEQSRRNNGPFTNPPGNSNGRLTHQTQTFRVEAEGIVDDRVAARLTAIVQKRVDGDQSVAVLEWSGSR